MGFRCPRERPDLGSGNIAREPTAVPEITRATCLQVDMHSPVQPFQQKLRRWQEGLNAVNPHNLVSENGTMRSQCDREIPIPAVQGLESPELRLSQHWALSGHQPGFLKWAETSSAEV